MSQSLKKFENKTLSKKEQAKIKGGQNAVKDALNMHRLRQLAMEDGSISTDEMNQVDSFSAEDISNMLNIVSMTI